MDQHGRRRPTDSKGVREGWDASHGAGCCHLVHLEARKTAAVDTLSISKLVLRRADTAFASICPPWRRRLCPPSPRRPQSLLPRSSQGQRRGGWTRPMRPHGEQGRPRGLGCITWRPLLLPRSSRGQQGRGCPLLVHLEARVEEGRYGRRVHRSASVRSTASAVARNTAAVVASSILRPASRRSGAAPRRARASAGVGTHHMAPAVVSSSISRSKRPWPSSHLEARVEEG